MNAISEVITTTEEISLQSIFDWAYHQFIVLDSPPAWEKGEKAMFGSCRYLTTDGRKCAIGLKLPDGHPAQRKICAFSNLVQQFPELWDYEILNMTEKELDGFQQSLHDLIQSEGVWRSGVEERKIHYHEVAMKFGLTVSGECS